MEVTKSEGTGWIRVKEGWGLLRGATGLHYRRRACTTDEECMDEEEGPDGLNLRRSARSSTGYLNVVKVRDGFHAKVVVDKWPAPQRTLPGEACATPREAAIRLARYWAAPYTLPAKPERRPRGKGKVCAPSPSLFSSLTV